MKKAWTKPIIRTFNSPEEAAAYLQGKASGTDREKIDALLDQAADIKTSSNWTLLRRSA